MLGGLARWVRNPPNQSLLLAFLGTTASTATAFAAITATFTFATRDEVIKQDKNETKHKAFQQSPQETENTAHESCFITRKSCAVTRNHVSAATKPSSSPCHNHQKDTAGETKR